MHVCLHTSQAALKTLKEEPVTMNDMIRVNEIPKIKAELLTIKTDTEHHSKQRDDSKHQAIAGQAVTKRDLKKEDCTRQDLQKGEHCTEISWSKQQSQNQNESTKNFHMQRSHIIRQGTYSKLVHEGSDIDIDVDVDVDHQISVHKQNWLNKASVNKKCKINSLSPQRKTTDITKKRGIEANQQ